MVWNLEHIVLWGSGTFVGLKFWRAVRVQLDGTETSTLFGLASNPAICTSSSWNIQMRFITTCVCACASLTGRAGDGDDASSGLSQQRQEALGDAQRAEEVDLHAASIVGHQ